MEIGAHASAPAPSRPRSRGAGVRRGERFGSGQPSNAGGSTPSEPGGVSTKGRSCTPPRSRCGLHGRPRGGALVGRPRCTRIFRAAASSSTTAMSSMRLAHFGQPRASIPQLRRRSVAHSRRRARVGSSGPRGSRASRAGSPGAERPDLLQIGFSENSFIELLSDDRSDERPVEEDGAHGLTVAFREACIALKPSWYSATG